MTTWGQLVKVVGTWGRPPDPVAWAALAAFVALAIMALTPAAFSLLPAPMSRRRFLTVIGFVAAFLSLGYVAYYLRGGPRIIDATTYFMQGRALSHGKFSWIISEPTASFRGRFLLFQEPYRLGGIFPPGYPLLLALGFLIGAPMVIGPVLAGGITVATYALAHELVLDERRRPPFYVPDRESIARFAAALSLVSAALRYHTADTMAHGAAALAITLSLAAALRARRTGDSRFFALAGLAAGYVAATRLASAIPITLVILWIASRARPRLRGIGVTVTALLPGLLLLAASQHAVTGDATSSTQRAYYAVSDGPPDCFRYGFGAGVGCLYEHGEFVRARLSDGFGVLEALGATLRRLRVHLADVLNFEPLILVLLVPIFRAVRVSRACRSAGAVIILHVLAYAPFYFDGNYPGGGARFFAELLPIEHAVIAFAIAHALPTVAFPRRVLWTLALACLGFAVHTSYEHEALANRDGGRPMYEPDLTREAGVVDGILFFDTDHGFNLACDPAVTASHGVLAARLRNDDHDRMLYDSLGHPPSHVYRFERAEPAVAAPPASSLVPALAVPPQPLSHVDVFSPHAPVNDSWRFEAEADWPPFAQGGGWAEPVWAAGTGASQDRVLTVTPSPASGEAWAEIELPVPRADTFSVQPRVLLRGGGGEGTLKLYMLKDTADGGAYDRVEVATWQWNGGADKAVPAHAMDLESREIVFQTARARMVLTAKGGAIALDKTTFLKATR